MKQDRENKIIFTPKYLYQILIIYIYIFFLLLFLFKLIKVYIINFNLRDALHFFK